MRFEVYEAKDGWRWRLVATNGKLIAESGEAYVNQFNARRAARNVRLRSTFAPIREI